MTRKRKDRVHKLLDYCQKVSLFEEEASDSKNLQVDEDN